MIHDFLKRNRFIRNLVLDTRNIKKLLELEGKSSESIECSVPTYTVSEVTFLLHGFNKFPLQFVLYAKPYGHSKKQIFHFVFVFTEIFFIGLRNVKEDF